MWAADHEFTHACVRVEDRDRVLVVDPAAGVGEALVGARAVLITHEHADHLDVACLAGWEVPVFAPADAAIDFAKDVEPEWLFAIHDGQLNGRGRSSLNNWCLRGASGYRYLAAGDTAW